MERLIATFQEIAIPSVLVRRSTGTTQWPDTFETVDEGPFRTAIDGYDIAISLRVGPPQSDLPDGRFRRTTSAIAEVSHAETEPPPRILVDHGQRDMSARAEYFMQRGEYGQVAAKALGRLLSYCKFDLWLPIDRPTIRSGLMAPDWADETGKMYETGIGIGSEVTLLIVSDPEAALDLENPGRIEEALQAHSSDSLAHQLLSDAVCAGKDKNLRRAVIEAAMACEVAVKQFLFAGAPRAEAAFAYLEDKGKVSAPMIHLIGRVVEEASGRSFSTEAPDSFKHIDHLFRTRNKVVHRAELKYRDDGGEIHTVDRAMFLEWQRAVQRLLEWLSAIPEDAQ